MKLKLAYISVYKDGTGYANQAVHNMLALEAAGVDVVARAVKFSPTSNTGLAAKVQHLEDKAADDVDVVIQHVLPHQFEYKEGVRNIGMFCWETTHFQRSNWNHCCNLMDEVWVPSTQNIQAAKNSGVTTPMNIFPCACDVERFANKPESLAISQLKNKCVFYTIGEMTRRKNIIAILRAYYTAFSLRDDVVLVLKVSIPGNTPDETTNIIRSSIEDVKKSMHTYVRHQYYPPVICISEFLPDRKLDQLHSACDVFVSASHGEAWGIPAHDAMGFGNPTILSNWGSYPELMDQHAGKFWQPKANKFRPSLGMNNDCGWLIDGQLTPCFGQVDSFPDLYTGDELWFDPNMEHMIYCMQEAYREWQNGSLTKRGKSAALRAADFSYNKVGKIAKQLLGC